MAAAPRRGYIHVGGSILSCPRDKTVAVALLVAATLTGCDGGPAGSVPRGQAAWVGEEPIAKVHLYENHSSALIAWKRARVRDRIVVHLDGHIDLDWLPDETVARIAAARPEELGDLEHHPYAIDGETLNRFGIWNFIYPAERLGLVRQLVWVVPDGTFADERGFGRLGRSLLYRTQMISLQEATELRLEGRRLVGTLLGIPTVICELADLPEFDEPVLLDIDVDYFSTASAVTGTVIAHGWITPHEVIEALRDHELRTDLVTLSMSTIGGFLPPGSRWIGRALRQRLRDPQGSFAADRLQRKAEQALAAGDEDEAIRLFRLLVETDADDPDAWFALCRIGGGAVYDAAIACARAFELDPLLEHWQLFEGDLARMNRDYDQALTMLDAYVDAVPRGPFALYAQRRRAGCLWELGQTQQAEALFREVLDQAPDHADTRLDLGQLLRDQNRLGEAVEQLELARAILPERATYALALGTTYLMAGRPDEALEQLREAVDRQPCRAEAQGNLAVALLNAGRLDEAKAHLATGLAIQPQQPTVRRVVAELGRRGVEIAPTVTVLSP